MDVPPTYRLMVRSTLFLDFGEGLCKLKERLGFLNGDRDKGR